MKFSVKGQPLYESINQTSLIELFVMIAFDFKQGQRHLDFVLKNQGLIDKTLLFDIELLKIIP